MRKALRALVLLLLSAPNLCLAGGDTFDSERFGLVLRRPNDTWTWRWAPGGGQDEAAKVGSVNGNDGFELLAKLNRDRKPEDPAFANVTVDCFARAAEDSDPVVYARNFGEAMRPGDAGFTLLEGAKGTVVGGTAAAVVEFEATLSRATPDGSSAKYGAHVKAWFVAVDNHWLRIIESTEKASWPGLEADLRKVLEGARFHPLAQPTALPTPAASHDDPLEGLKF